MTRARNAICGTVMGNLIHASTFLFIFIIFIKGQYLVFKQEKKQLVLNLTKALSRPTQQSYLPKRTHLRHNPHALIYVFLYLSQEQLVMRVWDVSPGYLNRQSLLGEHRELHGLVSILVNGKKGYSQHPETLRWVGFGWALRMRHQLLSVEMALRGYRDNTPVTLEDNLGHWPDTFIDPPAQQYVLLIDKYRDKEPGRIPLPTTAQQLWSQHKYSVLARDPEQYRHIGQALAKAELSFAELALTLTHLLRQAPSEGRIRNALQHMWGYVCEEPTANSNDQLANGPLLALLHEIQQRAKAQECEYLLHSTALSELAAWC